MSKTSSFDYILEVVLKSCQPELLFNMHVKESFFFFSDFWKVLFLVSVFQNVGQSSTVKNYHRVSFISVIRKIFEIL